MTKIMIGLVCAIIALTVALAFIPKTDIDNGAQTVLQPDSATTYLCEGDRSIYAGFNDGIVSLSLSDGREITLEHVEAASGAKYTNETGTTFWTKEYGAFIEESGTTTYAGCIALVREEDGLMRSMPTNFARAGVVTTNNPGGAQDTMYLVYEEQGAPALTKELIIDELSICAAQNGSLPCLAMSTTFGMAFGGKRVIVEGVQEGERLVVRVLRVLAEGEEVRLPAPGEVFVAWMHAAELIRECAVSGVMQTHALDVYVTLKNGERVRTIEPLIDEVFKVVEQSSCPDISVATE